MTIKEIAKLAGVSISTVSKIMNNKDESISAKTRENVLRIAKEYNYKPYASVLTPGNKSLVIGILIKDFDQVTASLSGMVASASKLGYGVMIRCSHSSSKEELKNITFFLNANVDGVLWEPVSEDSLTFSSYLEKANTPFLLMNSSFDDSFQINFHQMAYLATEKLIKNHHTDIACITGTSLHEEAFYKGYKQCLFDHHLSLNTNLVFHNTDIPKKYITEHLFSGLIAFRYHDALQFYHNIFIRHYHIPYDFSVISLITEEDCQMSCAQLSTILIPYKEFGSQLIKKLIYQLEKKEELISFDFPVELTNDCSIDIPFNLTTKTILSIGSINTDHYMNFDTLPNTGRAVFSTTSATYVGGKGTNEAIAVTKLGHRAALIGRIGSDVDADHIYDIIQTYPINASGVKRSIGSQTGKAYIFVQKGGDSMISLTSGANQTVTEQDILDNERLFINANTCLLQTEIPLSAILKATQLAKKYHATTVLKPSACSELPVSLLENIDIIIPNLDEINDICPGEGSIEEKAEYLLSLGIQIVIITLGADGCYVRTKEIEEYLPAASFTSIDTAGAGDAFISAFISYRLYDYDILSAAKIATYAAGFSTTTQGTVPALIDKNTLESIIWQKEPELLKKHS